MYARLKCIFDYINMKSAFEINFRLPLLASMFIFGSIGITQYTIYLRNTNSDYLLEKIGDTYMDGLISSSRDDFKDRNLSEIERNFRNAFIDQVGISEVALFAFDEKRELIMRIGDESFLTTEAERLLPEKIIIDHHRGLVLVSRGVSKGQFGYAVAALKASDIIQFRNQTTRQAFLLHIALGFLFSLVSFFVLLGIMRPIEQVTSRMLLVKGDGLSEIPQASFPKSDARVRALFESYNTMVREVARSNELARQFSEQEKSAALGRLSAMLAHEVRNPLGGLKAAVSTVARYGDQTEARNDAVAFLERGIGSIEQIVTSTLNYYRPVDDHIVAPADLNDLRLLTRGEAERRQITIQWDIELEHPVRVHETGIRQVLLNLLLNACAVTPRAGIVRFAARAKGSVLHCVVSDQGPGISEGLAARLTGDQELAHSMAQASERRGIGTQVVALLIKRLGGNITVRDNADGGTDLHVTIPVESV